MKSVRIIGSQLSLEQRCEEKQLVNMIGVQLLSDRCYRRGLRNLPPQPVISERRLRILHC